LPNSKTENEVREQRILDAAAPLIMRQGYDKTTMGDVADEVGVSRGIIYLRFDSKKDYSEGSFGVKCFSMLKHGWNILKPIRAVAQLAVSIGQCYTLSTVAP
jgi:hypothetical protein